MGTPSVTVYLDYKGTMHTFIKLDDGNGTVNQANGSFSFVVLPQGTPGTDDQDDQDDQDDLGGGSEVIRTMNLLVSSLQQQAQSLTTALNQPFGLIPERMSWGNNYNPNAANDSHWRQHA